ncbi:polysaccharide deacetylase family protein [Pseudomonas sp. 21LCFQ02]|uniref:polysaccharide deacetylase family protein n=1 Tax=unclassified Pseudomonas TaxID=196821 RepID=UPI0004F90E36|nr:MULTISPECIES: polysaccharide deacetylase family protein [unclassified Pseudomonas]MCO8171509.1 polysaccharide deacetylase family protein [Pseudomonas sp. 21LCFQ02]MCQ9427131.1 polysaccharide deacetylase family protein [Pseudomonas sp. LJDD11]BAP44916.1 polysaccharide deacetylase family protein [Pseudomonas sp. StFLB209]
MNVLNALCLSAVCLLAGCIGPPVPLTEQTRTQLSQQAPVRFVLTFDDGPSGSGWWNPTARILDDLADNPVMPGIKAVFFVQTGAIGGGGSDTGRELLRREGRELHILGFHSATPRHTNHRSLSPEQLEQSLRDGLRIIAEQSGQQATLLRPPFWNYDHRTFAAYRAKGLRVLLTDLSANDGKIYGFNMSPRRRANLLLQVSQVRERIARGELPTVDGATPVVVTFHDVNRYTARHIHEYLQILIDSARADGLPLAAKPFYDDQAQLLRAATARTVPDDGRGVHLPGIWDWLWDHNGH